MKKLCKKFDFLFTKEKIKIYIYTGSQLISFLMAFLTNLFSQGMQIQQGMASIDMQRIFF